MEPNKTEKVLSFFVTSLFVFAAVTFSAVDIEAKFFHILSFIHEYRKSPQSLLADY